MSTEIAMNEYGKKIGSYIDDLQDDVESRIDDINGYLKSASLFADLPNSFFGDETKIDFSNIDRATDIIKTLMYDVVKKRKLIPDDEEVFVTHIYKSNILDSMQDNLISFLKDAGTENIKDVSASLLSDSDISNIESSYQKQKQISLNMKIGLLGKYPTENQSANIDWISDRNEYQLSDFKKKLYSELFELAQTTAEWASSYVVNIEELHADFTSSYNSLLLGLVDANIAAYNAEVDSNLANLKNQITKIEAEIDINSIKADQKKVETSLKVEQDTRRFDEYTKHYLGAMKNSLTSLDINLSATKSMTSGYKSILAALSQRYSAIVLGRQ